MLYIILGLGAWADIWVTPLGWNVPLLLHCGIYGYCDSSTSWGHESCLL